MKKYSVLMAGFIGILLWVPVQAGWSDLLKGVLDKTKDSQPQTGAATDLLSNSEMTQGVLDALSVGVKRAIAALGSEGGYMQDVKVRIPMPEHMQTLEKGLRSLGQADLADEFVATMNRAAERAAPQTVDIFMDTIRDIKIEDARQIVSGADDAATQYLRTHAGERLKTAILPVVRQATGEAGVTNAYKGLVKKASFLSPFVDSDSLDLDTYIGDKALDGMFLKLAEEELKIRKDPVARSTDILKKVFSSIQ